jgi:hypothetical protein
MRLAYAPACLHAADARHVYVEQDRLALAMAQGKTCIFAAGRLACTKSHSFECLSQALAQRDIIFNYQY